MPEKKNPIIRREVFTVASTEMNDYGALIVNDTAGKQHKIGDKRPYLFPVFQPGADVQVGYSSFKGKDYIAEAEQTGGHKPVGESPHVPQPSYNRLDNTASIEKQVAVKEIGECWRAGKFQDDDKLVIAYKAWLLGRMSPPSSPVAQSSTPVTSKSDSDKPVSGTGQPEKTEDLFPDENPVLVEALKCKDGQSLAVFAGKHGITLADFQKTVGCSPVKVADVEAAARALFGNRSYLSESQGREDNWHNETL